MPHSLIHNPTKFVYTTATLTLWLTIALIPLNDNLIEASFVQGTSMSPSLCPSYHTTGRRDAVLWNKWVDHSNSPKGLKRGDIVLFRSPTRPDCNAVKRVVGLEGDRVFLDPRRRPEGDVSPESRAWDAMASQAGDFGGGGGGGVVVPPGHIWVEGDYWRKSQDSNAYGPVSKSLVLGKAMLVLWPWDRCGTRPWERYRSATRVVEGKAERKGGEMGLVDAIRSG
ncbi:hypothetical protein LTR91_002492 [Friedmanniomyces endolithicus]|uniref:Mitochondrial inner membrane protease subunit n=1 Tax=Friedmanniomyces endolithicus TaxID=329885 RepID=A0A4U0UIF1_9PEZI|nr:hypothetical protein LTS09_013276 [Friedmanniomyces endolithicus]KAK0275972.1 hypothetical protein LTR35_010741 [Friedmanniomyces endolithicus]KAK0292418.1 hypothetical protein LTS00_007895 [Friedmanniomyces endolithicus]KAK0312142.1 hypothetical protein LTR01_003056 [Friedmanniomyces endolithicus]KAK0321758.1 hypothetical protein LTR82_007244 [Friedmanniomyces endolithicus]